MESKMFDVVWMSRVEAINPLEAARIAFETLRYASGRPTRFEVSRWEDLGRVFIAH